MSALAIGVPIVLAIAFVVWSIVFVSELMTWGITYWWELVILAVISLVYAYGIGWLVLL